MTDDPRRIDRLLWLVDHGTRAEKIEARAQLGRILERRGIWDGAAECYEANIRDGVRGLPIFARLGMVYLRGRRFKDAADVGSYLLGNWHRGLVARVSASSPTLPATVRIEGNRLALVLAAVAVALATWTALRPSPPPQQVTTVVRPPSQQPQQPPPIQYQAPPRYTLPEYRPPAPDPDPLGINKMMEEQRAEEQRRRVQDAEERARELERRVERVERERQQERDRQFWESLFPRPSWENSSSRCAGYLGC